MANVFNRTTGVYLVSVNTPDYDPNDWIIFNRKNIAEIKALDAVPQRYWKASGETVIEMTQAEKDAVDAVNVPTPFPEHADNAAAIAAGLGIGSQYRTVDTLKIVH